MNKLEAQTTICEICCNKTLKDLTQSDVLSIKPALFKKTAKTLAECNPEYPALAEVYKVVKDNSDMVKMILQITSARLGIMKQFCK